MSSSALEASASIVESVFYYPHGAAQNFRSFERAVQDRPGSAQDLRDHLEGISSSSLSSSSSSLSSSSSSPSSEYFENENDGRTIDRGFGSALPASTSFAAVYPSLQDLLAQPVGREGMLSAYAGEAPDAVNARSAAMRACIGTIDQSMHKLFSELNLTAFDSVAQFIRGAFQEGGCCDPTPRTQSGDHFDHCQQFLPTAIVCAGLNLSDHGLSFRHLRTHLEKHCTPHVASLRARDCRRSKDCMSSLYLQFAGRDRRADDGVSSVRSGAGDATSLSSNAGSLQVALRDDEEEQHRRSRHTRETTIAVTAAMDAEIQARDRRRRGVLVRKGRNGKSARPLQMLANWYNQTYRQSGSTTTTTNSRSRGEASTSSHHLPILVVFIEDFEFFKPSVIQETVAMLAHAHQHHLPLAVIFGVASVTGSEAVHARIPRPLTSMLWMRAFELESSVTTLEKVVDQLLMRGELPLLLGASSASWLMDRFLMHTFSVTSFLRGLKFVAIEHFSQNRLSALCTTLGSHRDVSMERQAEALCAGLGYDDLRHLRDLKSVKAEWEGYDHDGDSGSSSSVGSSHNDARDTRDTDTEDLEELRERVKGWLVDFQREKIACHAVFCCILDAQELAAEISANAGQAPFRKMNRRKLYVETLRGQIHGKGKLLKRIGDALKFAGPEDLRRLLRMFLKSWKKCDSKAPGLFLEVTHMAQKIAKELLRLTGRQPGTSASKVVSPSSPSSSAASPSADTPFEAPHSQGVKRARPAEENDGVDDEDIPSSSSAAELQRPVSKKSRGERLQWHSGTASDNHAMSGALRQVQKDTASLLEDLVKHHLFHLESLPLNEVMVYKKNPSRLKKAFAPRPRGEILSALTKPHVYLGQDEISPEDTIQQAMPDQCILYKLLKERKINVNLYDWFESFCGFAASNEDGGVSGSHKTRKNRKTVAATMKDPSVQARFIRGMADLQFIGTFAPKNRKKDHVSRLVYGPNI
jgi:origin recognition complex subunit 3